MAKKKIYPYGFLQPAVFIFDAQGDLRFSWIQNPKITNLYGAARRMEPEEILTAMKEIAVE